MLQRAHDPPVDQAKTLLNGHAAVQDSLRDVSGIPAEENLA